MNIGRSELKNLIEGLLIVIERLEIVRPKTFWWEDACYLAEMPWESVK